MSQGAGTEQQVRDLRLSKPQQPFTLAIGIDAWDIRERGESWGQAEKLRTAGQEPAWWHWVYRGTCFRLSRRAKTEGGRSVILSRGTVMPLGGTHALKQQLWAEGHGAWIGWGH
jgi:hypothetical protein